MQKEKPRVSLYLTLYPQDADLLRAAVPAGATAPTRGLKPAPDLARMALGAVCRAILVKGYRPQVQAAEWRLDGAPGAEPALEPNVIRIDLGAL